MKSLRQLAIGVAFVTWLYVWTVLHGASSYFDPKAGGIPVWLVGMLGAALFFTIGTSVTALMRLPVWPWLAIAGAFFVVAGTLGYHFAEQRAFADVVARGGDTPPSVTLLTALRGALRAGAPNLVFFIVSPIVLAATGIMGWLWGPRRFFAPEEAPGA